MSKITQVCTVSCDNKPYEIKAGKIKHVFCCQKGFEKSLKDFTKYIKSKTKH